jgi:predicted membrane-bound mannosyltransferase
MSANQNPQGLTFTLCFSRYAGFHIFFKPAFRICLGWVGITICPFDLEAAVGLHINEIEDQKQLANKQVEELQNELVDVASNAKKTKRKLANCYKKLARRDRRIAQLENKLNTIFKYAKRTNS